MYTYEMKETQVGVQIFIPYEEKKIEVWIDTEIKKRFCLFPCEWVIEEKNHQLFVVAKAFTKGKLHFIYLHQFVLEVDQQTSVQFMNQNTLDNRKMNLKITF